MAVYTFVRFLYKNGRGLILYAIHEHVTALIVCKAVSRKRSLSLPNRAAASRVYKKREFNFNQRG